MLLVTALSFTSHPLLHPKSCTLNCKMTTDRHLEEPVKRWKRRRNGTVPADVKLPHAQFRQLRRGALLEHVLDYYSEHEADQAQAERWRVHLGQDSDRRSKALRAQIERKVREG